MDGIARKGAADGVGCLWWHPFVRIVESMHRQTDLPKMVGTAHSPSCFSSGLNGWQQKTNERSDDRDRHQKLDQCKASPFVWHLDTQGALIVDCNKRQTMERCIVAKSHRLFNILQSNPAAFELER